MKPTADSPGPDTRNRLLLGGLGAVALVRLWILPLGSSLSLDEFGTWWVTNGGLGQILSRAKLFPQSVLYAATVWLVRALAGASEVVLRLPSLLAAGLASYFLYRLGKEVFDREPGLLAAAIFIGVPQVCFAAGDARPYALGVLATVLALWMLVRWLDSGRPADALGYSVSAVAAIYLQYLFAVMLLPHAVYALRRWRRGGRASGKQLMLVAAAVAVLAAPAAALMAGVARDREIHAFGPMPGWMPLAKALLASSVLAAVGASALVCWAAGRLSRRPLAWKWGDPRREPGAGRPPFGDTLWLLSLCAFVPPVLLFLVSHATGTSVFVARYMLCGIPGQVLLLAWLLRAVEPARSRGAIIAGYLGIMILARGVHVGHTGEDWRGMAAALRAENRGHPVLLAGTFTESRNLAWVEDPRHASYMRAPLEYYPTGGPVSILPLRAGIDAEAYAQRLLDAAPAPGDRLALVERSSRFPSWAPWLEQRLAPRGYRMRGAWDRGFLRAWLFERSDAPGVGPRQVLGELGRAPVTRSRGQNSKAGADRGIVKSWPRAGP